MKKKKAKLGRPATPDANRRDKRAVAYLTEVEMQGVVAKALREGLEVSVWCRKRLLEAVDADDPALVAQQVEMGKRIGELRRKRRRVPQIG